MTANLSALATKSSFDERRDQLAEAALRTLGERGYANTSLRDIAQNSEFTHGVIHYYFTDKTELIIYCVRYYKARCVRRYDGIVSDSNTAEELLEAYSTRLAETIVEEGPMHRLWYDMRTQSMFDERLRPDVLFIDSTLEDMIRRILTRFAELSERPLRVAPEVAYPMLDGVFESALLNYCAGDQAVLQHLRSTVSATLPLLLKD